MSVECSWLPIRSGGVLNCSAALVLSLLLSTPVGADVRIHGATTVAFGLIKPQKSKIEKLTNLELAVLPSSTGHGLADLIEGRADIAMLAEPLESAVEAFNAKNTTRIDSADYVGRHVGDAFVQIIIHPSNPIKKLSKQELAGLFSGKIRNWAEIAGNNQPVLLVGEPTSSPYRMIKEALGISYPSDMRIVQNTNQTAIIVAQAPGAISNISTAHDLPERNKLKVVETELSLPLHLYLAFRKGAPEDVRRVVDAAASVGAP